MAVKVNESTEVSMPLKLVALLVFAIVAASGFVFHIEERIDILSIQMEKLTMNIENYKAQPSRSHTDVEILKVQLEHLQAQINSIKEK
jgi:chromosome segregation ATPase|tara:strand:- start:796 stop:1059 length:264 start_codon:yes stop_codon:yes gene_type:complete